jgi:hypothetical protein
MLIPPRTSIRFAKRLERDTAVARVLEEQTTIDLALVKVLLLEPSVGDIRSTSRLLEYTELVLAATSKVDGKGTSDLLEWCLSGRVEDGYLARDFVSIAIFNS